MATTPTPGLHQLIREHINFVNPLDFQTPLTDATLQLATDWIDEDEKTLLLTPGVWTIANNLTIPHNVTLLLSKGAMLSVNSGRTLTIEGEIQAGDNQHVFDGDGSVAFGGYHRRIPAGWFGVSILSADNQVAINKANSALTDGMDLEFGYGVFLTSPLTMAKRGITWRGAGHTPTGAFAATGHGTKLRAVGAQAYVLRVINQYSRIEDLALDGNFLTSTSVLFFESSGSSPHNCIVERVLIERTEPDVGVLAQLGGDANLQVDYVHFRHCTLMQDASGGSSKAAYGFLVKNTNTFLNRAEFCIVVGARVGVEWRGAGMDCYNVQVEGQTISAFQINLTCQPLRIVACYSETPNVPLFRRFSSIDPNPNTIRIEECQFNSTGQSVADWDLSQPTILIGNKMNENSWVVDLLGGGADRYRLLSIGSAFTGSMIGFGGAGLQLVDEYNTYEDDGAGGVATRTTVRHAVQFSNANITSSGIDFPNGSMALVNRHTETWNPGEIAVGENESVVVSITGAAVGDVCHATFSTKTNQPMHLSATVQSPGSVYVLLTNHHPSDPIDLGSGDLTVTVMRFSDPS